MIALEISVNGKRVQTISADDPGFVQAYVSRGRKRHEPDIAMHLGTWGINLQSEDGSDSLQWPDRSLAMGDEVLIRIVEVEQSDEPTQRHHIDSSERERQEREMYERLKAKYEEPPFVKSR